MGEPNVCRCCLLRDNELVPLFNKENGLSEKLMKITTLTLLPEDGLPSTVCTDCSQRICDLYDFKVECEFSDAILRKFAAAICQTSQNHDVLSNAITTDGNEAVGTIIIESDGSNHEGKEAYFENISADTTLMIILKNGEEDFNSGEEIETNCESSVTTNDLNIEESRDEKEFHINAYPKNNTAAIEKQKNNFETEQEAKFICEFCGNNYTSQTCFRRHKRRHSGIKTHMCVECDATFYIQSDLENHFRIHTGEKPFQCSMCERSYPQKSSLHTHIKTHNDSTMYECQTCNKKLANPSSLRVHERRHTDKKNYKCSECGREFTLLCNLKQHIDLIHLNNSKEYQCTECGEVFRRRSTFRYHMLKHKGEKLFQCDTCNKSFLTKPQLKTHSTIHTGEKPPPKAQCEYCKKLCFNHSELRVHLRMHNGERPYACTVCEKRFKLKIHLTVHERQHTGDKPYKCEICETHFVSSSSHKKHMLGHDGTKNFCCDICGKKYSQPGILNYHLKSAHKIVRKGNKSNGSTQIAARA